MDKLAYDVVKFECRKVIGRAKEVERKKMGESLESEEGKGRLFRAVKQMVAKNKVVVGGECLKDEDGKIVVESVKIREL